jgi:two-component system, OmpR family, alkaline phosphatase synthesis response regulator PhoP
MMQSRLVAIVEDEKDIAELVAYNLTKAGYEAKQFHDGESFLSDLKRHRPDLVILDLMLPGVDGLEVCRVVKGDPATRAIPILMLTAKGTETDRVVGLELGADDYVVKPFSPRELTARVKAILRRSDARLKEQETTRIGQLVIDPNRAVATIKGKSMDLTATEFRILEMLCRHPDRVFSRNQVLEYVWGYDKPVVDRTIDVHILNLREKLGPLGDRLKTVRGMGYKFASE